MSEVKLFRKADQDLVPPADSKSRVLALVNIGNSEGLGAGIGFFDAGLDVPWTVTYDEVLFIHEGRFTLRAGDALYHAEPGDTLWIPAGTELSYVAPEPVTFFYAVHPVANSPSTGKVEHYPAAPGEKAVRD